MATLLQGGSNSLLITYFCVVKSLLPICAGIIADFEEATVPPSPNLNLVSLCFSSTFSLSSGDKVSK